MGGVRLRRWAGPRTFMQRSCKSIGKWVQVLFLKPEGLDSNPVLLLPSCVTLGTSINLSESQYLQLYNEVDTNSRHCMGLSCKCNELISVKPLG